MSLDNPWAFNWEETPEKIDQEASARNSKLDAGYYRCKVIKTEMGNEKGEQKFTFQVIHGPAKGRYHFETLDNPRFCDKEERAKALVGIAKTWASRLGAIPRGTTGMAAIDWTKAVGQEMIIRIMVRTWPAKDGKAAGESHEIGWSGLWPIDHEDVAKLKNDVRESLGLPAIPGNDPVTKPADAAATKTASSAPALPATIPTKPAQTLDQMAADIFG